MGRLNYLEHQDRYRVVLNREWEYRGVLTFGGVPFVLKERVEIIGFTNKHKHSPRDSYGTHKVSTGDMKIEALEDAVTDGSKKTLAESINTVSDE